MARQDLGYLITVNDAQLQAATLRVKAFNAEMARSTLTGRKLDESFRAVGRRATEVGKFFTRAFTLPLAVISAASIKLAGDFDVSMAKIKGLVGGTDKELAKLRKTALDLASSEITQGPTALADAMFFLRSVGLSTNQTIKAIVPISRAAVAGLGSVAVITEAVTSVMDAYGFANISAAHATDVLVQTVTQGKIPPEQLAASLGRVIPIANAMGISFDQVGAALASMTRQGLSANLAVTGLRAILSNFQKGQPQTVRGLAAVGTSVNALQAGLAKGGPGVFATLLGLRARVESKFGKLKGEDIFGKTTLADIKKGTVDFGSAMDDVVARIERGGKGAVNALSKIFPNIRALTAFLILVGPRAAANQAIFQSLADTADHLGEATNRAFAAQKATPIQQLRGEVNKLKVDMIAFGHAITPAVTEIVSGLASIFHFLIDTGGTGGRVIRDIVIALALLGPGIQIFGRLTQGLSAGIFAIGTFQTRALKAALATKGIFVDADKALVAANKALFPMIEGVDALTASANTAAASFDRIGASAQRSFARAGAAATAVSGAVVGGGAVAARSRVGPAAAAGQGAAAAKVTTEELVVAQKRLGVITQEEQAKIVASYARVREAQAAVIAQQEKVNAAFARATVFGVSPRQTGAFVEQKRLVDARKALGAAALGVPTAAGVIAADQKLIVLERERLGLIEQLGAAETGLASATERQRTLAVSARAAGVDAAAAEVVAIQSEIVKREEDILLIQRQIDLELERAVALRAGARAMQEQAAAMRASSVLLPNGQVPGSVAPTGAFGATSARNIGIAQQTTRDSAKAANIMATKWGTTLQGMKSAAKGAFNLIAFFFLVDVVSKLAFGGDKARKKFKDDVNDMAHSANVAFAAIGLGAFGALKGLTALNAARARPASGAVRPVVARITAATGGEAVAGGALAGLSLGAATRQLPQVIKGLAKGGELTLGWKAKLVLLAGSFLGLKAAGVDASKAINAAVIAFTAQGIFSLLAGLGLVAAGFASLPVTLGIAVGVLLLQIKPVHDALESLNDVGKQAGHSLDGLLHTGRFFKDFLGGSLLGPGGVHPFGIGFGKSAKELEEFNEKAQITSKRIEEVKKQIFELTHSDVKFKEGQGFPTIPFGRDNSRALRVTDELVDQGGVKVQERHFFLRKLINGQMKETEVNATTAARAIGAETAQLQHWVDVAQGATTKANGPFLSGDVVSKVGNLTEKMKKLFGHTFEDLTKRQKLSLRLLVNRGDIDSARKVLQHFLELKLDKEARKAAAFLSKSGFPDVANFLKTATKAARDASDIISEAFGSNLEDKILGAFTSATDRMLDAFDSSTDKILSSFDKQTEKMEAALSFLVKVPKLHETFRIKVDGKTPAERELEALDKVEAKRRAARDLFDANKQLSTAFLIGDPEGIRQAQRAREDALGQSKRQKLEARAQTERAAADAAIKSGKDRFEAGRANERQALERRRQALRRDIESTRALQEEQVKKAIEAQIKLVNTGKESLQKFYKNILGIMASNNLSVKQAGADGGKGFAKGLGDALDTLKTRVHNDLAKATADAQKFVTDMKTVAKDLSKVQQQLRSLHFFQAAGLIPGTPPGAAKPPKGQVNPPFVPTPAETSAGRQNTTRRRRNQRNEREVDRFVHIHPGYKRLLGAMRATSINVPLPLSLNNKSLHNVGESVLRKYGFAQLHDLVRFLLGKTKPGGDPILTPHARGGVAGMKLFSRVVPGFAQGDTVPAMLKPGELILNQGHQEVLKRSLGVGGNPAGLFGHIDRMSRSGARMASGGIAAMQKQLRPPVGRRSLVWGHQTFTDPDKLYGWAKAHGTRLSEPEFFARFTDAARILGYRGATAKGEQQKKLADPSDRLGRDQIASMFGLERFAKGGLTTPTAKQLFPGFAPSLARSLNKLIRILQGKAIQQQRLPQDPRTAELILGGSFKGKGKKRHFVKDSPERLKHLRQQLDPVWATGLVRRLFPNMDADRRKELEGRAAQIQAHPVLAGLFTPTGTGTRRGGRAHLPQRVTNALAAARSTALSITGFGPGGTIHGKNNLATGAGAEHLRRVIRANDHGALRTLLLGMIGNPKVKIGDSERAKLRNGLVDVNADELYAYVASISRGKARFGAGGRVGGLGSGDSVPALLTPGELVLGGSHQEGLKRALGIGGNAAGLFSHIEGLARSGGRFAGGGTTLPQSPALSVSGFGEGSGGTTVHQSINIDIHDSRSPDETARSVRRELLKHSQRNASQLRGRVRDKTIGLG